MNDILIIQLARDALITAIMTAAPMLLMGLSVGVFISLVQTTTSIQEQTLTFIPKLCSVFLAIVVFGNWMLHNLVQYTHDLFANLDSFVQW